MYRVDDYLTDEEVAACQRSAEEHQAAFSSYAEALKWFKRRMIQSREEGQENGN